MIRRCVSMLAVVSVLLVAGCRKPHVTAVSLQPCNFGEESGIPFYLPKPLLIVSKNFRHIEEAKVGLTDTAPIPNGFDDQAKYADVNARTNFNFDSKPAGSSSSSTTTNTGTANSSGQLDYNKRGAPITPENIPSDGLGPDTFYTYQVIFVPDLSQKYGLKIRGGPGEIRAAMNLVNGWQFTGLGPYYMKDSSTAQNILSEGIATRLGGQAVQDVLKGVGELRGKTGIQSEGLHANDPAVHSLASTIEALPAGVAPMKLTDFAEIRVYEPSLMPDGMMSWQPIAELSFDREYLGSRKVTKTVQHSSSNANNTALQSAPITDPTVRSALQAVGIPIPNTTVQSPESTGLQSGSGEISTPGTSSSPGNVNQIHIDCGNCGACEHCQPKTTRHFSLFNFPQLGSQKKRGKVETRFLRGFSVGSGAGSGTQTEQGGGLTDPGIELDSDGGPRRVVPTPAPGG